MFLPALKPYLTLSDINVIAPAQIHPQAAEVQRIVEDHCMRLGIMRPNYHEYTTMSSYLFPRTSIERLVAINILMNLLYYIDDVYDRHQATGNENPDHLAQVFKEGIAAFRTGAASTLNDPVIDVCLELHRQFSALTSPAWLDRLIHSLLNHLKSTLVDSESVKYEGRLNINEYLALRDHDSGMQPTIDIIEFAEDIFLPDSLLLHPYLRRMRLATARIGGLLNDLFSYTKEVVALGSDFNLVTVMMDDLDCTFDEAVHYIVHLLNIYIKDFLDAEKDSPLWIDPAANTMIQKYVQGLRDQVIASWHWQMSTNRYRSPLSPFPELRVLLGTS